MAVPSVKTTLREELLRIMREDITYQVQDGDDGKNLDPSAIVYKPTRVQKNRDFETKNQLLDLPGIILSEPKGSPILSTGGTNERDRCHYFWVAQLVDTDLWEVPGRVATWDKWSKQICSALMFSCLNGVVTPPTAQVIFTSAQEVSDIDENTWVKDAQFISAIEIEVRTHEPRGIIA